MACTNKTQHGACYATLFLRMFYTEMAVGRSYCWILGHGKAQDVKSAVAQGLLKYGGKPRASASQNPENIPTLKTIAKLMFALVLVSAELSVCRAARWRNKHVLVHRPRKRPRHASSRCKFPPRRTRSRPRRAEVGVNSYHAGLSPDPPHNEVGADSHRAGPGADPGTRRSAQIPSCTARCVPTST